MPVTLQPLLTFQGPSDAAPIDVAAHFESFSPEASRDEIEFANFGDLLKKIEKGRYTAQVSANLKPTSLDVLPVFLGWLAEAGDVTVVFRHDSKQPVSAANPEMTFPVAVTDVPLPGGDGNSKIEKSVTWRINGPIQYDHQASTVTIGG